ncbi:hypothetical protein M9H77_05539 [Catharanthus roseus]|uniref:Uncharacterized protein n=1 Tax=Catharanthus roseus TaxID=4058 RepID=A0ACC0CHT6_CATRO|nr:hypothetical protein M9H77_05539 [Catharanthus roseus]
MHLNLHPIFSLILLLIASLTLIHIPKSFCQDQRYVTCGQPFRCGRSNFNYPFWGGDRPSDCGYPGFNLSCQNNVAILAFESLRYRALSMNGQRVIVARDDLWDDLCPTPISDTIFNSSIFRYSSGYPNVTLSYGCSIPIPGLTRPLNQFDCQGTPSFYSINAIGNPAEAVCNRSISVPINQDRTGNLGSSSSLQEALKEGFGLEWEANNSNCEECDRSGGRCGYNSSSNSFVCFCTDRPYDLTCNGSQNTNDEPSSMDNIRPE